MSVDHAAVRAAVGVVERAGADCLVCFFDGVYSYLEQNPVFELTRCKTIGESAAVVSRAGRVALVAAPAWDAERLRAEAVGCSVFPTDDVVSRLAALLAGHARVAVAGLDLVPLRFRTELEQEVAELVAVDEEVLGRQRAKTEIELVAARRAAAVAEQAYAQLLGVVSPGIAEYELIGMVDVDVRRRGADDNFVLSSSSPRGDNVRAPTARRLELGDVLNIEVSPSVDGQFVQICRTAVLGEASAKRRSDYALLVSALGEGMAAARPGATVAEVVAALDAPLVDAGLAEFCRPPHIRVRGHGQGLASLSPGDITWDNETRLEAGMMFTLHPNQRFPESGYMLCGEPVVVTQRGACPLTVRSPALDELGVA